MTQLHLALLGQSTVRHDGVDVAFPTRKALALLAYLAVEGGLHTREKMAGLLWPASDHQHARAMLRYTVTKLRPLLSHPDGATHLRTERDLLGSDPGGDVEIDLQVVQAAHGLARRAGADHLKELQGAAMLYRGELLEGFSLPDAPEFDEWASLQREIWRQKIELVLDRLSQLHFDRGEHEQALVTVERWLSISPLDEEAHRRLIRLYFAAGDRSAATRAYESCRALLERELNMPPAPETLSLIEQIRNAVPLQRVSPRESSISAAPTSLLEGPLVGRSDEVMKLVGLYYRALQGQPQVVVLEGEAGIGKTRLAQEFLGWAAAQGADVLQGRAFETGGGLPYQPLLNALRPRLERENAPEDLLSDVWLVELSRILPELRDRYPDLQIPAGDEAAARIRLFEAIVRLGQALAKQAPVVLFVDDVQWADAGSLDILQYAARRWAEEGTPALLILSLRSEAAAMTPWLAGRLDSLRHELAATSIGLRALSFDDTLHFVQGLADPSRQSDGAGPATPHLARFAAWLFSETSGQPFFVVESLRALLDRGVLTPRQLDDGGWGIELQESIESDGLLAGLVPPGVRSIVHARLARLSAAAHRIVDAAAVLGQGFTFDQLREVARIGEDEALTSVDEVLRADVLRETTVDESRSLGTYAFAHDKIRDVAYAEASLARRRIYHGRAVDALLGVAPLALLARHALAAGLEERAVGFDVAAGNEAMELLAARDAIAHYERALEGAKRLDLSGVESDLLGRLGKAFVSLAQWTDARGALELALKGLTTEQDERRAEILVDLLEVCWWLLDMSGLRSYADEALTLALGFGRGDLETAALGWLAAAVGADGDVTRCVEECSRSVERANELGIPAPPQVHTYISLSFYWLGRLGEAITRSTEGVAAARAANHTSATMWCLPHLGIALAASGQYGEAARVFDEARSYGREYGVSTLLARAIAMSAGFHLDVFDFEGNEALAGEARELAWSLGFSPPAVSAGIDLLLNFARRGEIGRAESLLSEVTASVEKASGFHGWLWALRLAEAKAEIALAREDWLEALHLANQAVAQSHGRRRVKYEATSLSTRARALHSLGRTKEAIADLRIGVELARQVGDPALLLSVASPLLVIDGDDVLAREVGVSARMIAEALPNADMKSKFEASEAARLAAKLGSGWPAESRAKP